MWALWAVNLVAQNFMFTIVSRARNSGSLRRHVVAAIGSNGVWILQMQIMLGPLMDYLNGKHGALAQVWTGIFYTLFTVAGSVLAHRWALSSESGKSAVGANARYAQITKEEWAEVHRLLSMRPPEPAHVPGSRESDLRKIAAMVELALRKNAASCEALVGMLRPEQNVFETGQ